MFDPLQYQTESFFFPLFVFFSISAHSQEIDKFRDLSFNAFFTSALIQHFQHQPWSLPSTRQRTFGILRSFLAQSLPAQGPEEELLPLLRWHWFTWRQSRLCTRLARLREQFDEMRWSRWTSASQSIFNVHLSAWRRESVRRNPKANPKPEFLYTCQRSALKTLHFWPEVCVLLIFAALSDSSQCVADVWFVIMGTRPSP